MGVAGDIIGGRAIVLADHSIFIDEMMRPTDNDNVEFAANCMTYLCGDDGRRTKVLFVEEGRVQPTFDVPTKPLPAPPLSTLLSAAWRNRDKIVELGNKKLERAQDKLTELDHTNAFNRGLLGFLEHHGGLTRARLFNILLLFSTLGVLIYGCYRLGIVFRYRPDSSVPSLTQAIVPQRPTGSLLDMRHEDLLQSANIWEAGRQLARDAFGTAGVAVPVPYREPSVKVQGGWWRRFQTARRVRRLWRLAYLNKPSLVAPLAALALAAELDDLTDALKRGTIQVM